MNRVLLIAPMVVFGVAGLGLWLYLFYADASGPFHDNMVPELIGFCLEGFILVGLLTLVQQARENARRRELRLSLRGSFRSLLSLLDIAFLEPYAEPTSTRQLETDPAVVDHLLRQLADKHPDLDSLVALKREAGEVLPLTRDLVAVAAQLSAIHMNWWVAIVHSIRQIVEAKDRAALERALYDMLVNIKEFDHTEA